MTFTDAQKIEAARKRLGDLKAVHLNWKNGKIEIEAAISEMEHIAYSVTCYLDGVPGQYLKSHEGNAKP